MKANIDKQVEELVSKMMKETILEKPSNNFTAHVMAQVTDINLSKAYVYKPLISKWVWYILFVAVSSLVIYLLFNNGQPSNGWLYNLNFSSKFNFMKGLSSFHYSKTTVYACVLLTVMLFIQIPILKHHMDKRLEA